MPRPAIFRDAMQISPEQIAAMDESDLGELMRDLLRVQAYHCHSPLSEVRVNTEEKAKDGGCDGWTAKPEIDDGWLGDANTCWQFKAGTAGTPAHLAGEAQKPIPSETLQAGGRFVVVANSSTNGKSGENSRLNRLRDEAEAAGLPTGKIEVIGSERLATWCNQNPAVAARWSGRPEAMWTLDDWSNAEIHQVPWQASDDVKSKIEELRAKLDLETGEILHLHIQGHPGVGKTRFALELCREAPWSASVIYIQQATDLRLLELIDSAASDPNVRLMVVADEVQLKQLRFLRDSIGRGNGRLRLITIGHCPTSDPTRIPAFRIDPLGTEEAGKVVKGWYPAMPPEHVDFVVRFADGYVRLARLAADAVFRDPGINAHGLLSRDEIRLFLDGMLGTGDRRALHVVAVLTSIGWTHDKEVEGKAVANHLGLDWNDVRAKVDDFDKQFGIAPRGGRYRYISPTPLGTHLAVEAWTAYPDLLRDLPNILPTEEAKEAYFGRLHSITSNPQAREYAREELAFFFRLDDFVDPRAARRWSSLSAADPERAARNIFRALNGSSVEERLGIEDQARREIVWTLIRLAWRPGSFHNATKALALLAEAENETWGNNATGEFLNRFQVFLGGTAVPYTDRISVLDELVSENRANLTRLVIKALTRIGDNQSSRFSSEPASDELPEEEWGPSSREEHLACIQTALHFLTDLAETANPQLNEDIVDAAKKLATMLRGGPDVRCLVERLFEVVRRAYPDAREPLRRAIGEVVHHEQKYWRELPQEELNELKALEVRFEDSSLKARLRQYVGPPYWEPEEQPDLLPLAQELLESEEGVPGEWTWLTSGEAESSWLFGEALGKADLEKTLAGSFLSIQGTGRDLRIICGYIHACRQELGDDWYDMWFESVWRCQPLPVNLIFEVVWRCGATATVAQRLAKVLRTEEVAPEIVGRLAYGKWGEEIPLDLLKGVLQGMIDSGHYQTALPILARRIKAMPGEIDNWRQIAIKLIVLPELIRSRQMTNYYWKELALQYTNDYSAEIAKAILREQGDRTPGAWFTEHSDAAKVLLACTENNPDVVWSAIASQLSSLGDAYSFSIGFPHEVVDRIPPEQIMAWVDKRPDERARMVSKLAGKNLSGDGTLPALLLGAYGDRDDVASSFFSAYVSGMWSGPSSAHWEKLSEELKKVANRTTLPKLKIWASEAARELERMAERDHQREEEEEVRGYH